MKVGSLKFIAYYIRVYISIIYKIAIKCNKKKNATRNSIGVNRVIHFSPPQSVIDNCYNCLYNVIR